MSRTLVFGDIHGGLRALEQVLDRAKVTVSDKLIFLGDFVDGWNDSPRVIDYLIGLEKTHSCVYIRGNHEDTVQRYLSLGEDDPDWRKHGGQSTIDMYQQEAHHTIEKHIDFFGRLNDYHIDENNRLFVHAGFTNQKGVEYEYFKGMYCWDRTLWEAALAMDNTLSRKDLFFPKRMSLYHEIFIGHTPVTRIGHVTPVNRANLWNVDTGAAFKGRLTAMDVDSKQFWQSEPLHELYPNERGRN